VELLNKGHYPWKNNWDTPQDYGTYENYWANAYDDNNPPLLQPGFDYEFMDCQGATQIEVLGEWTQPSNYSNLDWEYIYDIIGENVVTTINKENLDFNTITHPNSSAIRILQLENKARRCYDLSTWRPYIDEPNDDPLVGLVGGKVVKFNDGTFNANITITPKDSTQINSPDLINDLDNGLYIIQKEYIDGSKKQKALIKDEN